MIKLGSSGKSSLLYSLVENEDIVVTNDLILTPEEVNNINLLVVDNIDCDKLNEFVYQNSDKRIFIDFVGLNDLWDIDQFCRVIRRYPDVRFVISAQLIIGPGFKLNQNLMNSSFIRIPDRIVLSKKRGDFEVFDVENFWEV